MSDKQIRRHFLCISLFPALDVGSVRSRPARRPTGRRRSGEQRVGDRSDPIYVLGRRLGGARARVRRICGLQTNSIATRGASTIGTANGASRGAGGASSHGAVKTRMQRVWSWPATQLLLCFASTCGSSAAPRTSRASRAVGTTWRAIASKSTTARRTATITISPYLITRRVSTRTRVKVASGPRRQLAVNAFLARRLAVSFVRRPHQRVPRLNLTFAWDATINVRGKTLTT